MASRKRRHAARRRSWGRGPTILRFEPLEGRRLLSSNDPTVATTATATAGEVISSSTDDNQSSDVAIQILADDSTGDNNTDPLVYATAAPVLDTNSGAPDLVIKRFDMRQNLDWGENFQFNVTIANEGTAASPANVTLGLYASVDQSLDVGDVQVGTVEIPASIAPGASTIYSGKLKAPAIPLAGLGGNSFYYMMAAIDPANKVAETIETNNANQGAGFDIAAVNITPKLPAQLVATSLSANPSSVKWGANFAITATIQNTGRGDAPATNARLVLIPTDNTSIQYTLGYVPMNAIPAGQSITATQIVQLPQIAPKALASASQFALLLIPDADAAASSVLNGQTQYRPNIDYIALNVQPATNQTTKPATQPDLRVSAVQSPASAVTWGQSFQVGATIANKGNEDIPGSFKVRFVMVQSDDAGAPQLVLGDVTVDGLKAGYSQDILTTVSLPYRIPDGMMASASLGRIIVQVDSDTKVIESNETNNSLASTSFGLRVVGSDGQIATPTPSLTTTKANPDPVTTNKPRTGSTQTPTAAQKAQRQAAAMRRKAMQEQRRARLLAMRQKRQQSALRIYAPNTTGGSASA